MAGKPLLPSAANVKHAHRVAAEIRDKIRLGTFVLYDYFPDSPSRLLKYSPTCGLPPLALALFFRQVSVS